MGGEITWTCQPNGQYVFTLILYRDCNGIPMPSGAQTLDVTGHPSLFSITLNHISTNDITYCQPTNNCAAGGPGTVEEGIWRSNPITITGVPPATGWMFSWSSCCRNGAITNLANFGSFLLRAKMYPYNGTNTNPCFDSSPQFSEKPNTILCTGFPFTYNHNAYDPELDSLVYSWDTPLDDVLPVPNPVPFAAGYSFNSPLPSPAQNPSNVAAVMNPNTGEVTYTSFTAGNFVTVTKVTAYKCGIKVAEIFREIQITLLGNCPPTAMGTTNFPPIVTAPFQDPNTLLWNVYSDTITAGDSVSFFMSATDFDFQPAPGFTPQKVSILGTGSQFGAGFSNPNAGCLIPPCAITSPALPILNQLIGAGLNFGWKTTCDHLGSAIGCVNLSNTFTFLLRAQDDFCPAPGIKFNTVTIVVLAPPQIDSSLVRCASVDSANGNITLSWEHTKDKDVKMDTMVSFHGYYIYHATNPAGPYALIDSVKDVTVTSYTHTGANGNNGQNYYYTYTSFGCEGNRETGKTDTISSIYLTVGNTTPGYADLSWNPLRDPLLSSSSRHYKIYRRLGLSNPWVLIDSTLHDTTQFVDDLTFLCGDSVFYRIAIEDSIGCTSWSNVNSNFFGVVPLPDPPELRCLSVASNGNITLNWVAPVDTGYGFSGYYIYTAPALAGPYVLIDSVTNYFSNTYVHSGAGGNNASVYYSIKTRESCANLFSDPSDTLRSIFLTVNNVAGNASLNWNHPRIPLLASHSGWYRIYKEYPLGTWSLLDSVQTLTYTDPISLCNDSVNYRIQMRDASGCDNVSNVAGQRFIDNSIPDPPSLRCIAVNPSGSITLNWIPPTDTAMDFNSYHVWHSTTGVAGSYTLIDSLFNYATTSYTHMAVNANAASQYYYVQTRSGCGVQYSAPSTSLQSIYLTVGGANTSIANLSWNAIATPNLPSSTGNYQIYKEYPAGVWSLLKTTTALNALDTVNVCIDNINYRIEIADASGCKSISNINGNTFVDNTIPAAPDLRCIAVNATGTVTLTWIPPSDTAQRYNSYHVYYSPSGLAGSFVVVDSIFSYATTSYTHTGVNANAASAYYYVETRSGCGVQYSPPSRTLQSIYLTVAGAGSSIANLSWNAISIPNPPSSTGIYKVYRELPAGTWSLIANTPSLSYNDTVSVCIDQINYRIDIDDASGCVSRSNVNGGVFVDNTIPAAPDFRCVAVNPSGTVTLTWIPPTDTAQRYNSYHVYYSASGLPGSFSVVDSIFNYATTSYTHATVNANAATAFYYLETRSGCGVQYSAPSTTLQTIFVTVAYNGNGSANLSWNAISNPLLPSSSGWYNVYREYPSGSWSLVDNTQSLNDIDSIQLCDQWVNYRIEIADALGCRSISNVNGDQFIDYTKPAAPEPRCVNVNADGTVTLSWIVPIDTALSFNSYHVYYANNAAGPYTVIDSIFNYNTSSYTHSSVNAYAGAAYYYVETRSGCGIVYSDPSTTVRTINVNVTNIGNGVANISWNHIATPNLPTSSGNYEVYKKMPGGGWTLYETTTLLSSIDTITICSDSVAYYVSVADQSGCISNSTIDTDLFADLIPPVSPLIDTVSVNPLNGETSISWFSNPSFDTQGYIVYLFNGASWDSIGATYSINDLYLLNSASNANNVSELYALAAYDSCGNLSPLGTAHHTIYLTSRLDKCRAAIDLKWNLYQNMQGGVAGYNIYATENGGPVNLVGSVGPLVNSFSHTGLTQYADYCYYVQAVGVDASRTSSSNETCEFADILKLPEYSYVTTASVLSPGLVEVKCHVDTIADVSYYKLQRALKEAGPYFTIKLSYDTLNTLITFVDSTAQTEDVSYYYRVISVSNCNMDVLTSENFGRTILAVATPHDNLVNEIMWNDYEKWDAEVDHYKLYRKIGKDNLGPYVLIANLPAGVTSYLDNIAQYYTGDGYFCYYVEAFEGAGNKYGYQEMSVSNETCPIQAPHLTSPNAFTPGGKNPVFYPFSIFIDTDRYSFKVFNRWGEMVFATTNPQEGWDGSFNSSTAPEGVYVYIVELTGTNGDKIEKLGRVTLLR
ncbi:MAG TPA: gliding motility-associated C-terminal domain-containing protein [Bacteroidia bacterium]|nr:gliding motility-associated C-terminal domain-containing protein [Bacteroidia bacterium]